MSDVSKMVIGAIAGIIVLFLLLGATLKCGSMWPFLDRNYCLVTTPTAKSGPVTR